jgi:hypothetical protein
MAGNAGAAVSFDLSVLVRISQRLAALRMRFLKNVYYVVVRGALVFCGRSDPQRCRDIEERLNLSGTTLVCSSCPWWEFCGKRLPRENPPQTPPSQRPPRERPKEKGTEV